MKQLDTMPGDRPKYLGDTEETLNCRECGKDWTRISRRGRKPPLCPDCKAKTEEKVISPPVATEVLEDRLALARAKKAERRQERAKIEAEQQRERRERIAAKLPAISERWNRAFTVAHRENTEEAWNHCDSLMVAYVGAKKGLSK